MIDEMYDRAWGEHHQRFSQDVQALFLAAARALKRLFGRRMSSDSKPDISGSARTARECVESGAADIG